MSTSMSRIVFEIATANYLAGESEKQALSEALSMLPSALIPKKATSSRVKGVTSINGNLLGTIDELVPGPLKYEGDIRLYGGKEGADFGLFWKCGSSQWLKTYKGMPTNVLLCSISTECIASSLEAITGMWASLCEKLHTIYGYAYLESGLGTENPRGQGLCLPRLHRYTFFGEEYSAVLDLSAAAEHLKVERCGSGAFLFRQEDWLACLEPNEEEARLMGLLGASYFWDEGDCWRNPKASYSVPAINFKSLECEA
jgi:hypothetical protein